MSAKRLLCKDLRLYYRENCHLCESLVAVLYSGWPDLLDNMEWCDIDTRSDWQAEYGLRIPVLYQGGELVCELQADLERLTAYFGSPKSTDLI